MKWTITGNGSTSGVVWPGGRGVFTAFGTFGSGTIKLQVSYDDGTTWMDVDRSGDTYCTFTSNGSGGFELPKCQVRANTAGSTTPSVTAGVQSAKQSY
ncbi:hypothetical protein CWO91_16640 [Bradyrhizobium genosp. SA-3]|nr:hypothetical protein CWO91_16640 [Bradyrhizobium genosp. SA-3]